VRSSSWLCDEEEAGGRHVKVEGGWRWVEWSVVCDDHQRCKIYNIHIIVPFYAEKF
jgi:hypothetical protein